MSSASNRSADDRLANSNPVETIRPKQSNSAKSAADPLDVYPRIDRLRRKLLDLSRANPLIAARLSFRSNSVIRAINELPELLLWLLVNGRGLRFKSLPPLEVSLNQTPIQSGDFKNRPSLGPPSKTLRIEQTYIEHAKNHGLSPDYDLPIAKTPIKISALAKSKDVQTLLPPPDMERKLVSLRHKCRQAEEETGVNALKAVFGFLEWVDLQGATLMSPLVLLSLRLTRQTTSRGQEFLVLAEDDEAEVNFVLAEKLKTDLGLELPDLTFNDNGFPLLEDYFIQIDNIYKNNHLNRVFKVRRQVAFGLFPSSRLAMYEDLAKGRHDYQNLPLIQDFVFGANPAAPGLFADDYEIDRPEIEAKIPGLVLDADSSQASILVDLKDGRNLAVEGPPGTGKSQTIVNAIAAALADGKTVLFVAEKQAALEVVRSRLEAVGLGEYLLPLQAQRSTRSQAMAFIRARLGMTPPASNLTEYQNNLKKYQQLRDKLNSYATFLSSPFRQTGLSVYQVIGRALRWRPVLKNARDLYKNPPTQINFDSLSLADVEEIVEVGQSLYKALTVTAERPAWGEINVNSLNLALIGGVLSLAQKAGEEFAKVEEARDALGAYLSTKTLAYLNEAKSSLERALEDSPRIFILANMALELFFKVGRLKERLAYGLESLSLPDLLATQKFISQTLGRPLSLSPNVLAGLAQHGLFNEAIYYYENAGQYQKSLKTLTLNLYYPDSIETEKDLKKLVHLGQKHHIVNLDPVKLADKLAQIEQKLASTRLLDKRLGALTPHLPDLGQIPFITLSSLKSFLTTVASDIINFKFNGDLNTSYSDLKAYNDLGEALVAQRQALNKKLALYCPLTPKELRSLAKVFLSTQMVKFVSLTYFRAKRIYLTITKRPYRPLIDAARDLNELADWKEKALAFTTDPKVKAVYGQSFKGLKTDFAFFAKIASFWGELEFYCPATKYPLTLSYLKKGRSRLWSTIERTDFPRSKLDFDRQRERLPKLIAQREVLKRVLSKIDYLALDLKPTANWRTAFLKRLQRRLITKLLFEDKLKKFPELIPLVKPIDEAARGLSQAEWADLNYFAGQQLLWPFLAKALMVNDVFTISNNDLINLFSDLETCCNVVFSLFNYDKSSKISFINDIFQVTPSNLGEADLSSLLASINDQPLLKETLAAAGYASMFQRLEEIFARLAAAAKELTNFPTKGDLTETNALLAKRRTLPKSSDFIANSGLFNALENINSLLSRYEEAQKTLKELNLATGASLAFNEADASLAAKTLTSLAQDRTGLLAHLEAQTLKARLNDLGFACVVSDIEINGLPKEDLGDLLMAMISQAALMGTTKDYEKEFSTFKRVKLDDLRAELAATDKTVINLYRQELRRKAFVEVKDLPWGVYRGPVSSLTEMGLITHELKKKTRYVPIREITKRAGAALIALKPCWMMSPLAISTYLPAGGQTFDLGVIDEASQMTPENALGALVRCQKIMVVGDDNQLPPTNFFRTIIKEDDDEGEEERGLIEESILEVANSVYLPGRRLRWHYRSRHPSLIQFSNSRIYNDELMVFPAPNHLAMGV
ncbi:MAG: DUF4011 domain-containing protein, partial [Deltaproteobacteria bacterium]|nr:DUF4011 domain-containing protein [Deltaproteobacteria bacterium]